jgi:hypothetical protein
VFKAQAAFYQFFSARLSGRVEPRVKASMAQLASVKPP